jgi:dihydrofolate reductase
MIKIIAAITEDGLFGQSNGILPWKCKEDLNFFYSQIEGKTCILGNSTYKTLPRLVKSLVSELIVIGNSIKVEDWKSYLTYIEEMEEEIIILGGKSIIKQCLPYSDQLILSKIHKRTLKPLLNPLDFIYFPELALASKVLPVNSIISASENHTTYLYNLRKHYENTKHVMETSV